MGWKTAISGAILTDASRKADGCVGTGWTTSIPAGSDQKGRVTGSPGWAGCRKGGESVWSLRLPSTPESPQDVPDSGDEPTKGKEEGMTRQGGRAAHQTIGTSAAMRNLDGKRAILGRGPPLELCNTPPVDVHDGHVHSADTTAPGRSARAAVAVPCERLAHHPRTTQSRPAAFVSRSAVEGLAAGCAGALWRLGGGKGGTLEVPAVGLRRSRHESRTRHTTTSHPPVFRSKTNRAAPC